MPDESILGRAKIPISGDLTQLDKDLSEARSKVGNAVEGIVGNVKKIGGAALAGIGILGGAATAAAGALGKLAIDAAPVEGLRDAFEGLAVSSGSSMDEMLAALQRGSSGMISQRDLMMSYNQASQLVSTTFANQLPDAMKYLSKVSASTGQDMGFLLDSLVKGVGRVSPMILDNLGIQVSLAEATDEAAKMFGVEASALDKTQIQAGMMNVVLAKLAQNTEAMPDVSDSAAAGLARLQAKFQDTKDQVGLAFLPTLNAVMGVIGDLADRFLPPLLGALEAIAPIVADVVGRIGEFIGAILDGQDPLVALRAMLEGLVPPQVIDTIEGIIGSIEQFIGKAQEVLAPVMDWISQNVELQDVLIALGIAIGAVVVPALVSVVTAVAPIIAVGAALIAAVVLLRKAWETDFMGIRTFVEDTLAKIRDWWAQHGEEVIAKAKEIYETVKAGIETAITVIRTIIETVLERIRAFWEQHGETIMTVIQNAWDTIKAIIDTVINNVKDIIEAVSLAIQGDWHGFGEKLREIWDRTWALIAEILGNAWENIKAIVSGLIENVIAFFRDTDWGAVGRGILEGIAAGIRNGIQAVIDAARAAAKAALDAALGFLGIGSPSRVFELQVGVPSAEGLARGLEQGIGAVRAAAGQLAAASLSGAESFLASGATLGSGVEHHDHWHLNINTQADAEDVAFSYNSMRAMAGY